MSSGRGFPSGGSALGGQLRCAIRVNARETSGVTRGLRVGDPRLGCPGGSLTPARRGRGLQPRRSPCHRIKKRAGGRERTDVELCEGRGFAPGPAERVDETGRRRKRFCSPASRATQQSVLLPKTFLHRAVLHGAAGHTPSGSSIHGQNPCMLISLLKCTFLNLPLAHNAR